MTDRDRSDLYEIIRAIILLNEDLARRISINPSCTVNEKHHKIDYNARTAQGLVDRIIDKYCN